MSSTASDDDDESAIPSAYASAADADADAPSEPKRKYKRRKIAIFLGYCGAGYQGMQKNPGARTIEADLEEALFLAGSVPAPDRGNPKRYDWARSARTDKGVSAVGQVVSGRFYIDPPGLVDRLNSALHPQIRVFGFKRATASFNAKKFCDRRRYVYLLPVFALDPSAHPDRESVIASLGSGNELARCFECSDRGRKVDGVMGRQPRALVEEESSVLETGDTNSNPSSISESRVSDVEGGTNVGNGEFQDVSRALIEEESSVLGTGDANSNPSSISETRVSNVEGGTNVGNDEFQDVSRISEKKVEAEIDSVESQPCEPRVLKDEELAEFVTKEFSTDATAETSVPKEDGKMECADTGTLKEDEKIEFGVPECASGEQMAARTSDFHYGEKEKERFNGILKRFVGTHNFHNFTTRTKAEDPSARRYIVSFTADSVVSIEGIDFIKCEVVGQSFMLHQIRKMIGFAVAMMRNCAPESLMDIALRKDVNINVPTAPEVGLYLDECFFTSYNKKWKDTHEEVSMESYSEQAEEFKMKNIYSHIASMEHKEGAVALWLHSLNHRNYTDLNYLEANGENVNAENTQKVDNLAN